MPPIDSLDDLEKLQSFFQTEVVGIMEAGPDGAIARVNRGLIQLLGYERNELLGKTFHEITFAPDQALSRDYLDRLKRGDINVCQFQKRYLTKSGMIVPVLTSVQAGKRDADGRPQWFVTFVVSLAEVQRVRAALTTLTAKQEVIYNKTIQVLARAVESRDPYTAGHQANVASLAVMIGERMGLGKDQLQGLHLGAMVHDIGKISVPSEFLTKPTVLTELERAYIQNHAETGYRILQEVETPWPLAEMVYQHHERLDGSGYPRRLSGNDIILEARIIAVADTVDSMIRPRPYRRDLGAEKTMDALRVSAATQKMDADVVDACLGLTGALGG